MAGIVSAIVNLFTGGVAQSLADAYKAKNDATTEHERIAAEIAIAKIEERQETRALGGRLTAIVQALWAAPFVIYDWKLIVWDKVFAMGATDALSNDLASMQIRIASFYFGGAIAVGVVRAIRR